jgi:hypothetical protein
MPIRDYFGLASALTNLVGVIGLAGGAWKRLVAAFSVPIHFGENPFHLMNMATRAVDFRERLFNITTPPGEPAAKDGGLDIGKFLAPDKKQKDNSDELMRKRLEALSRAHDYDERQLRAQEDILKSQQSLSQDFVERGTLAIQLLDLDRKSYAAQLAYEVKENEISKGKEGISQAQADILMALYDQKDHLDRANAVQDEELTRQKLYEDQQAKFYELGQDRLKAEDNLAETATERRRVELEILDLAYKEKKERLERIIAQSQDDNERELARKELAAMPGQYKLDRAGVNKATQTPLEAYMAQLPLTADKMTEALQRVQVHGLQMLEDGILGVITGTMKLKDAFHNMAAAILEDLLRIAIEKYIIGTITSALGLGTGAPPIAGARAGGGPVMSGSAYLVGENGPEIFTPTSSGHITANDNVSSLAGMSGAPRVSITNNNDFRGSDPAAVSAISSRVDRMERELPSRVVSAWSDARKRFVIR